MRHGRHRLLVLACLLAAATAPSLAGCTPATGPDESVEAQAAVGAVTTADDGGAETDAVKYGPADFGHIHGLHPAGDELYIASHHGLFVAGLDGVDADGLMPGGSGPVPRGPLIDLMGFAAGGGSLYASGHPGTGTNLPDPVGLLRSDDDGATWEPLSRTGQSDFHALTTAADAVVGFDGALMRTEDGEEWETVSGPAAFALAGHPDGDTVLAATQEGIWRSEDAGKTWAEPSGGPLLQYLAFADAETAVGIAPDGVVHVSEDAGSSWEEAGDAGEGPAALAAEMRDGELHVWAAVDAGVVHSDDGGATFSG
ncbi:hypothetical protein BJH93_13140 [Kocuria polaris]|nr:hypothetical protein [Kocuria polaris]